MGFTKIRAKFLLRWFRRVETLKVQEEKQKVGLQVFFFLFPTKQPRQTKMEKKHKLKLKYCSKN